MVENCRTKKENKKENKKEKKRVFATHYWLVLFETSILMCIPGELAGGRSVALAVGVSDKWQVTGYTQQVTYDLWHLTLDIWHLTPDT